MFNYFKKIYQAPVIINRGVPWKFKGGLENFLLIWLYSVNSLNPKVN